MKEETVHEWIRGLIKAWAELHASGQACFFIPNGRTDLGNSEEPLNPYRSYFRLRLAQMFLREARESPRGRLAVQAFVNLPSGDRGPASAGGFAFVPRETPQGGVRLGYLLRELMPYNLGPVEIGAAILSLSGDAPPANAIDLLQKHLSASHPPSVDFSWTPEAGSRLLSDLYERMGGLIHLAGGRTFSALAGGDDALRPGYYALVGAGPNELSPELLYVRDDTLYYAQRPSAEPRPLEGHDYLLLFVEGRDERVDWGFDDIQESLDRAVAAYAGRRREEAEYFRQLTLINAASSPRLTSFDQRRLVQVIHDELEALARRGQGATQTGRYELGDIMARRGRSRALAYMAQRGPLGTDEFYERYIKHRQNLDAPPSPRLIEDESVAVPEREVSYRSINAWIDERVRQPEKPLEVGETYTLKLNVGRHVEGGLIDSPAALIADSDIPEEGLFTEWIISSRGVMLEGEAVGTGAVWKREGDDSSWEARFPLHIPKWGDSEVRRLRIRPERAQDVSLEVLIFVGREVYRRFRLELLLSEGLEDGGARSAVEVAGEAIAAPGKELNLVPATADWTPPGSLSISVLRDGHAYVRGTTDSLEDVNEQTDWYAAPQQVAGILTNLGSALDQFRAATSKSYLNAVEPDDLARRLTPDAFMKEGPDEIHEQVWRGVSESDQLRKVAHWGHRLYQTLFPEGTDLRRWVDDLSPGWRLDISWTDSTGPHWVPHVPWGLMYRTPPDEDRPVDPFEFLGLRLRGEYRSHYLARPKSRALGGPAHAYRAKALYWGAKETDEVIVESRRQQAEWGAWDNLLFIPGGDEAAEPMKTLIELLKAPTPKPMSVIYFYCVAEVNDGNNVLLRFGKQPSDILRGEDLGLGQWDDQPFVFVNSCVSSHATAYVANEMEQLFFSRGCRAYLGTETYMPIQFASRFASVFYHFFYRRLDERPISAGEAAHQARLFFWRHYRNIGGLLYTYINQYELYLADKSELKGLKN